MGGQVGEVRGTTKRKAYVKYKAQSDDFAEGTWSPDPEDEDECINCMIEDRETKEWVLKYQFHT
jgi:hypothetical protein